MKTLLVRILLAALAFLALPSPIPAQGNATSCIANIQKRLDALGRQADFDFLQARQVIRDFNFGKVSDFTSDVNKRTAFQRVWTSLGRVEKYWLRRYVFMV